MSPKRPSLCENTQQAETTANNTDCIRAREEVHESGRGSPDTYDGDVGRVCPNQKTTFNTSHTAPKREVPLFGSIIKQMRTFFETRSNHKPSVRRHDIGSSSEAALIFTVWIIASFSFAVCAAVHRYRRAFKSLRARPAAKQQRGVVDDLFLLFFLYRAPVDMIGK